MRTKWKQELRNKNGNKVGTRTPKWEQEWEQELQSRTRMGTKWEQEPKVGQEWTRTPK